VRIFLDTEFIEDGRTIDLVSIGMVREDGRSYYAQALGFDPSRASKWVQDNVLSLLRRCDLGAELAAEMESHERSGRPCSSMCPWRSRAELRQEIMAFVASPRLGAAPAREPWEREEPEFWADYASYDWVALCQIFGTMMEKPDGWPAWCRDVQQLRGARVLPVRAAAHKPEHFALNDAKDCQRRHDYLKMLEGSVAA
jgi:hypothetical protein